MSRRAALMAIGLLFLLQWLFTASLDFPNFDGLFYYGQARSLVLDGDLNLANDIVQSYPMSGGAFENRHFEEIRTATGYVDMPFPVGTAFLWLPWLALRQLTVGTTGYEWQAVRVAGMLSTLVGVAAFRMGQHFAARFVSRKAALAATLTLMLTTPLVFYQFRDPFYSHTLSAAVNTLVVVVWYRQMRHVDRVRGAFGLGLLLGLSALVRWQNAIYTLLPAWTALLWWLDRRDSRPALKQAARYLGAAAAGTLLMFSIQMAIWRVLYGSWLTIPQGSSFVDWRALWLWPTLFSPYRGLLAWMPIIFPAFVGLLWLCKRHWRTVAPLLIVLILALYVTASTRDWFAGGGFGPRRFTSELVILLVGYAGFVALLRRLRFGTVALILLAIALSWHQWTLLRYGLAEGFGGTKFYSSAELTYASLSWTETSWGEFLAEFVQFAPNALRQPRDFWVLPASPLYHLLDGVWPRQHVYALGVGVLFGLGGVGFLLGFGRIQTTRLTSATIALTILAIILFDIWLLFSA